MGCRDVTAAEHELRLAVAQAVEEGMGFIQIASVVMDQFESVTPGEKG